MELGMKKTLSLLLAVMLFMGLAAVPAFADGEVVVEWDFNSGMQGTPSNSDPPAGYSAANYPSFKAMDGMAVFDTHLAFGTTPENTYVTGVDYPTPQSSGKPMYHRLNLPGSNAAPVVSSAANEENIHTYEVEIEFGHAFASTVYSIRYGNSSWVTGTTRDVNLFEVKGTGGLYLGSTLIRTLNLGQKYKISVAVDVRGSSRVAKMYIDGVYSGEITNMAVGGDDAASEDLKKAVYPSVVIRPYTGSGMAYKWVGTRVAVDRITVFNYDPYETTGAVTIAGEVEFFKSPHDEVTYTTYRAKNNGEDDNFVYSLESAPAGVTIDAQTGRLGVPGTAPSNQDIVIKAALVSNPSESGLLVVNIKDPIFYNFESGSPGWSASTGQPTTLVATDGDGNKYLEPLGNRVNSPTHNIQSGLGGVTFEYKTLATPDTGNISISAATLGADVNQWYFTTSATKTSTDVTFKATNRGGTGEVVEFGTFEIGPEWIPVKVAIDFDNKRADIYYDGELVAKSFPFNPNAQDFKFRQIFAFAPMDDIYIYSGRTDSIDVVMERAAVYIPTAGRVSTAKMSFDREDVVGTWALAEEYTGVSIDGNTGLLSVTSDASEQDIVINASADGTSFNFTYPLKKIFMDFDDMAVGSSPAGWDTTTVYEEDGGNRFVARTEGQTFARFNFADNTIVGRFVFEADVKRPTGFGGSIAVTSYGQSDWPLQPTVPVSNEWAKLRIIVDTVEKTYTVFLDDEFLSAAEAPMRITVADLVVRVRQFIFPTMADNVAVYTPGDGPPIASTPIVSEINVGTPLAATYEYFSENALAEECSTIEWLVSDTKDGTYTTLGAEYTPTAADAGKYFKARVTPSSEGGYVGAAVDSEPTFFDGVTINSLLANGAAVAEDEDNFIEGENTLSVDFSYINARGVKNDVMLILGYYVDGKLIDVNVTHKTDIAPGAEVSISGSMGFEILEGEYSKKDVKVFLFEKDTLKPLTDFINVR